MSRKDVVAKFAKQCPPELVEAIARETVADLRMGLQSDKRVPQRTEWDQAVLDIALAGLRVASVKAAGMNADRVRAVRNDLSAQVMQALRLLDHPPSPPDDPPPRKRAPRKKRRTAKIITMRKAS